MKKIIYIGAWSISCFGNVINADCCGLDISKSKEKRESLESKPLVDVEISINGVYCINLDNPISKNFEQYKSEFKDFEFGVSDISTNVHIFSRIFSVGCEMYVLVVTGGIVNKQGRPMLGKYVHKLGDTGCYVCCFGQIEKGGHMLLNVNDFIIEADEANSGKFNIKLK